MGVINIFDFGLENEVSVPLLEKISDSYLVLNEYLMLIRFLFGKVIGNHLPSSTRPTALCILRKIVIYDTS